MTLEDFIVKKKLSNKDARKDARTNTINPDFATQDYSFLVSFDGHGAEGRYEKIAYPTDYAVMNGAFVSDKCYGPEKGRKASTLWLRDASPSIFIIIGTPELDFVRGNPPDTDNVICPCMHLNIAPVLFVRNRSNAFKIEPFKNKNGKTIYHTIELGFYPQDKAEETEKLEKLYNENKLTPTGKTYTGYMNEDGTFQQNQEFEYDGQKYVRVISKKYYEEKRPEYKDKTKAPDSGTPIWAKVQPIKWDIRNWDKLPKEINPDGDGTASTIYIQSHEGLLSGIPFYPEYIIIPKGTMWQNSPIRAYLNGYNLHKEIEKGNGSKRYKASINYDFEGKGFLQEAAIYDYLQYVLAKIYDGNLKDSASKNQYKITVDEFWGSSERLAIITQNIDQAKFLLKVFNRMYGSLTYLKDTHEQWEESISLYKGNYRIAYDNYFVLYERKCYHVGPASILASTCRNNGYKVYNFEDVDLEKYLYPDEKKELYKINTVSSANKKETSGERNL